MILLLLNIALAARASGVDPATCAPAMETVVEEKITPLATLLQAYMMLAVQIAGDDAYSGRVAREIKAHTNLQYTATAMATLLATMKERGHATSQLMPPRPGRRGPGRVVYTLTPAGQRALENALGPFDRMRAELGKD